MSANSISNYVSDRVFEGRRPLSPERAAKLREKWKDVLESDLSPIKANTIPIVLSHRHPRDEEFEK